MTGIRLGFFKLNVPEMEPALAFWRDAFGFEISMTFDEPAFLEHALVLPGQEGGLSLMLVESKDGHDVTVGPGHGPVGLVCDDIRTAWDRALERGATALLPPFKAGGVIVAVMRSPQGHEVELVQMSAA